MTVEGFELAAPEVVSERFQEGLVVLNLDSGEYFDLGARAAPLLEALMEGVPFEALKRALEDLEPGAADQAHRAVMEMLGHGMIRRVNVAVQEVAKGQCKSILAAGDDFQITCHSDLAELIAADPIHDVDPETGKLKR